MNVQQFTYKSITSLIPTYLNHQRVEQGFVDIIIDFTVEV